MLIRIPVPGALVSGTEYVLEFDPDKIDKLLVMWERTKQSAAEAEFNDAMAAAQSEMDPIRKDSDNPQTRSRYASYAAMDRAVRPTYTKHGFCLSFNTEDILENDPLYFVLSKIFITSGEDESTKLNIADLMQQIVERLDALIDISKKASKHSSSSSGYGRIA